jgi:nanoRNase/pAp phosphatase (c-di-AMP/oligoRNAs hydrolase)
VQAAVEGKGPQDDDPPPLTADWSRFPSDIEEKLRDFRNCVQGASSVLILAHDYPDPDCLASAYGIAHLLSFWGKQNSIISFGGFVGRAENRAMIRFLNVSTIPYVLLEINDFDCIIMVDCFPGRNNVSLPASVRVHAVIDHHPADPNNNAPFFRDIRSDIGATSTIVTEYLLKADCPIPSKLATGLFYGIMTDTGDMGRDTSAEDLECYKLLFDVMDYKLLARIEHPDRDAEFFKVLHRAAASVIVFDTVGFVHLGQIVSPDYVGEMVDLFHSLQKIEITICSGIFKKNVFFSIRSKHRDEAGISAEKIARALGGGGGGHGKAGAGRIPFSVEGGTDIVERFVSVAREVFNISGVEGVKIGM